MDLVHLLPGPTCCQVELCQGSRSSPSCTQVATNQPSLENAQYQWDVPPSLASGQYFVRVPLCVVIGQNVELVKCSVCHLIY